MLPRPDIDDKQPEVIKENASAMEVDTHPKAPDVKGTAPNAPKDSAGSLALSQGAKSEAAKGHSKKHYLSHKGVTTKGKSPKSPI